MMISCIFRAHACPIRRFFATATCAALLITAQSFPDELEGGPAAAPALLSADSPHAVSPDDGTEGLEIVRRFDFDERPLGNYAETPLDWVRLDGEGLPRYSGARIDDDYGHLAPPSFRFDLQGGSVAYQYVGDDLPLAPGGEHLVVAYARAVGLRRARAFLQISLLDEVGNRLPGSDRVSDLIASSSSPAADSAASTPRSDESAESWQRLEVIVPTGFPDAAALRLTLWVLQAYAWREPAEVDPILRQDIGAQVWFDDLTLYRLPHVRVRLSTSSSIVRAGTPASFVIEIGNSVAAPLDFELSLRDAAARLVHTVQGAVPERVSTPLNIPVPPLESGTYTAQLRLCEEAESLGHSTLRFAVIPELPAAPSMTADFGVDLGVLPGGDSDGLVELIRELGCGAVKLGFPLPVDSPGHPDVEAARDLVRGLLAAGVEPIGVILPPRGSRPADRTARAALLAPGRSARLATLLLPLGNAVSCWQVGDERTELVDGVAWDAAALRDLRRDIQRFVAVPQIILPRSVFDAGAEPRAVPPGPAGTVSAYVPPQAPTRGLPRQLASFEDADAGWLMLETDAGLLVNTRICETARRLILAKASGAARIFVPAPLAYDRDGACWSPTEEYVALRTLFRFLAGKHVAAVIPTSDRDALAILFTDDDSACIAAWSWRDQPGPPLALCGAVDAEVWDLWGRHTPCETGVQTLVSLSAAPVIVAPVNAASLALQASLTIDPGFIDLDDPETHPVLKLCNPFTGEMAGTVRLTVPPYWRGAESEMPFDLSGGETLEWPLDLIVPPRETSGEKLLAIGLDLTLPVSTTVSVSVPVRVGLSKASFEACAWWQGADLIVEQVVRSRGRTPKDFACSCQAAGRPQLEGELLGIAPGTTATQVFQIPNARDLAGTLLVVGLREPGGRWLESVTTIPP